METYIKIYRKALSSELFTATPFDQWHAYEYLLLRAARFETQVVSRGKKVNLAPGQLIVSEEKLAKTWGWSRGKVRRFLSLLSDLDMIQVCGQAFGTVLTIENYAKYQCPAPNKKPGFEPENERVDGTTDGTADGTQLKKEKERERILTYNKEDIGYIYNLIGQGDNHQPPPQKKKKFFNKIPRWRLDEMEEEIKQGR